MTVPWLCDPGDLIYHRQSVLLHKEQCLRECMLVGPGPKCMAEYSVAMYCSLSLPFCALPGLLSTFLCLVSLQAVWWLCQRGRLCELCCPAEVCSGEWSCIPQRLLLLQWLRPPHEALWATQWGLVCEGVSIWLPVALACAGNLPMLCLCPLQNKLTIWKRQKTILSSHHTYALVFLWTSHFRRTLQTPQQSCCFVQTRSSTTGFS